MGSIESQYYLKHGVLVSISEQNLIDCSTDQINNGCNGGWMANAFQYLTTHSITAENEYPYVGMQRSCTLGTARQFQLSIAGENLCFKKLGHHFGDLSRDNRKLYQKIAKMRQQAQKPQ